jgi:hypothetical protein
MLGLIGKPEGRKPLARIICKDKIILKLVLRIEMGGRGQI